MFCSCPAPTPLDEEARLASLRRQKILDTGSEEVFERIVSLATRMLGVPDAMINFIDSDRQWSKASTRTHGFEVPRDVSFCAWAIRARRTIVVPDAREDARFSQNPLVLGPPHLVFYAGAPLFVDDQPIGTLCVFGPFPRKFLESEVATLESLAAMVRDNILLRESALAARQRACAASLRL